MAISRTLWAGVALVALAGCEDGFDFDFRDLGNGFDTSDAVQNVPPRPSPDERGVISYPNYQVAVAQRGDTPRTIAARLGIDAEELAAYNGLDPDVELRRDELVALPIRVSASPAVTTPIEAPSEVDVTTLASDAIDRAGEDPVQNPSTAPATDPAEVPINHRVGPGETIYSISRLYDVPVRAIAQWNGLGADLAVREGQYLLIPRGVSGTSSAPQPPAETPVSAPGTGSVTPLPPSATQPLPDNPAPLPDVTPTSTTPVEDAPVEAPNLGAEQSEPVGNADALLIYPVQGTIIRGYAPGRNEGIDISVPAGTEVKAAAAGNVAAVTTDTNGIAIVVIRHEGDLLTVYTNLDNLTVAKGDSVRQGQVIGKVREGDPSFLHFEVREGLNSADPADYLP